MECKYTSRGARLIEVNCRMGGGPVHTMNRLVWGVDLAEEQLLCTAGELVLVWVGGWGGGRVCVCVCGGWGGGGGAHSLSP